MQERSLIAQLPDAFVAGTTTELDEQGLDRMIDSFAEFADPQIECLMSGDEHMRTTYVGIDGVREAWRDWMAAFDRVRIRINEVKAGEDRAVFLVDQIGTVRGSSAEIEQPSGAVFWVHDGRLARVEFHLSPEAALAAAGLT